MRDLGLCSRRSPGIDTDLFRCGWGGEPEGFVVEGVRSVCTSASTCKSLGSLVSQASWCCLRYVSSEGRSLPLGPHAFWAGHFQWCMSPSFQPLRLWGH